MRTDCCGLLRQLAGLLLMCAGPMGSFVHLSAVDVVAVASWLERPGEELDCFYRFGGVGLSSAVAGGGIYREVLYAYICPEITQVEEMIK